MKSWRSVEEFGVLNHAGGRDGLGVSSLTDFRHTPNVWMTECLVDSEAEGSDGVKCYERMLAWSERAINRTVSSSSESFGAYLPMTAVLTDKNQTVYIEFAENRNEFQFDRLLG